VNHVRYTPVIPPLLLPPRADDICARERDGECVRTAPPAPAARAVPRLRLRPAAAPHPPSLRGNRSLRLFASTDRTPRTPSSQPSSITAAVTETALRRPELNWVSPAEKSESNATASTSLMYNGFF